MHKSYQDKKIPEYIKPQKIIIKSNLNPNPKSKHEN
jgi:hypothetical protein